MIKRLVVYGVLGMALALSTFTSFSINSEREETEIIIVNPINPLNPVVRNPYQEEYERMLYPTVRITSDSGTGSGVVISVPPGAPPSACSRPSLCSGERGAYSVEGIAILTAAHVVEDQSIVDVELYNLTVITGTVVITDTARDLALISIEHRAKSIEDKIFTAQLAGKDYIPYLFAPVWAVGCSLGLKPRPSFGHITSIEDSTLNAIRSTLHWEVSCPILPGNSGGPVYAKSQRSPDDFGNAYEYEVIGIAVWVKVYDGQLVTTMAGVVPIGEIYKFLDNHKISPDAHKK
ncbi:MAG: trypsin-like peptidase domain-containing protein [Planctomycetes bacterium]|nr:trypsin-like peptidase domain-containing protein [Planctomycetota bacterium]